MFDFLDIGDRILEWVSNAIVFLSQMILSGAIAVADWIYLEMVRATELDLVDALQQRYNAMSAIAMLVLIGAGWAGISLAGVKGDLGKLTRRLFIDGPVAAIVMATGFQLAVLFLAAVAGLETMILFMMGGDEGPFSMLNSLTELEGDIAVLAAVPIIIVAVFMVIIALLLGLFLFIRVALLAVGIVYIPFMAALRPTDYAMMMRLHVERLVQLALSKAVILIAMGVGAGVMLTVASVTDVYFISPPPDDPGAVVAAGIDGEGAGGDSAAIAQVLGALTAALGILVAAAASPWLVLSQLPGAYTEGSAVSGSDGGGSFSQARGAMTPATNLGRRVMRRGAR